jgi:hypothetical protein
MKPQTPIPWTIAVSAARATSNGAFGTISHLLARDGPLYPDGAPILWQSHKGSDLGGQIDSIVIFELRR